MKECLSCGDKFSASSYQQVYCTDRCRWRANKQKQYEERKKAGLCPQCGGDMTGEELTSYCDDCKTYFDSRYKKIGE